MLSFSIYMFGVVYVTKGKLSPIQNTSEKGYVFYHMPWYLSQFDVIIIYIHGLIKFSK